MIIRKYNSLDFDKDVGIGIKLPYSNTYSTFVQRNEYTSNDILNKDQSLSLFEKTYSTSEQVRYNLINLVLTIKGERVMHPTFGTTISSFLFEPIDLTLSTKLKEDLYEDIKYWMPYLIIDDIIVNITNENADQNTIKLAIKFKSNEFDDTQLLNIEFGNSIVKYE